MPSIPVWLALVRLGKSKVTAIEHYLPVEHSPWSDCSVVAGNLLLQCYCQLWLKSVFSLLLRWWEATGGDEGCLLAYLSCEPLSTVVCIAAVPANLLKSLAKAGCASNGGPIRDVIGGRLLFWSSLLITAGRFCLAGVQSGSASWPLPSHWQSNCWTANRGGNTRMPAPLALSLGRKAVRIFVKAEPGEEHRPRDGIRHLGRGANLHTQQNP